MAAAARKVHSLRRLPLWRHHHPPLFHTETPLQLSIRTAVETKNHRHIPHLLIQSSNHNPEDPEPDSFAFLSATPPTLTVRLVDDILQSFIPLRPRSLPHPAYASLLSHTLPYPPNPSAPSALLPLALAVLQTSIRSGFPPPPQTRLSLSLSWLHLRRRHHREPISRILSSMRQIGYRPDANTCNYLLSSLCSVSELEEAIGVLRGMSAAECLPDSESYCTVIEAACAGRKVAVAEELLREMVAVEGMVPRKGTIVKLAVATRKEGQVKRAAEVVRLLEVKGIAVGFEGYEALVEGCVERGEFALAGKVVVEMAKRGFIPYLKVRRRVVEGLARIGRPELAGAVRQSLAEIKS